MNSTIDWTGQLEVVDEGVTFSAAIVTHDTSGFDKLPYELAYGYCVGVWFREDGVSCLGDGIVARNVSSGSTEVPQATHPILPSTEQLDRFEALLGRLEGILGTITKGEAK